jgi:hypothetical protein
MAHGPTVAREYGIPAVICVRDATQLISTGQLITVDGTSGTVLVPDIPLPELIPVAQPGATPHCSTPSRGGPS